MKTSSLLVTLGVALALTGCSRSTGSANTASSDTSSTDYTSTTSATATDSTSSLGDQMRDAGNAAANALGNAASNVAVTARMSQWKLNPSDIQADLNNNKDIIRTKGTEVGAPTGRMDKSVIESAVKARLESDSSIAPLKLKVSANKEGDVKLSGKADSAQEVGRAIALALDTQGVTKVTSKVRLNSSAKTSQ